MAARSSERFRPIHLHEPNASPFSGQPASADLASAGRSGMVVPSQLADVPACEAVTESQPTVFMVDADLPACSTVRNLAATMNLGCQTYASGQEFLSDYDPARPGCLILELRIPGISGLEIQTFLAERGSHLPVIFLTAQATVSIAVRAMRMGALNLLEKPAREHELWDAIQEAMVVDRQRLQASAEYERDRDQLARLTPSDRHLLDMLAQGQPKQAIAQELQVCTRTVEIYRNRLMKKLSCQSLSELMHFALFAASEGHAALAKRYPR